MVRKRSAQPNEDAQVEIQGTAPVGGQPQPPKEPLPDGLLPTNQRSPNPKLDQVRTVTGDSTVLPFAGQIPHLPDGYEAIVTSVFQVQDPQETYAAIEAGLVPVKASRATAAELLDALDKAQEIAALAVKLLVNAKATADAVELDAGVMRAAMRDQASAQLEREKDAGMRKKTITDADVIGTMATMFPDEWRDLEQRSSRTKRTITYLEALCDRTAERARDLRAIVTVSRSV